MSHNNSSPAILEDLSHSIATVTFNRPATRNSLSTPVLDLLETVVSRLVSNTELRAIIFTGTRDVFLSGADISELASLDQESAVTFSKKGQNLLQLIADAPQVTIAAINGYCMGGGLDLALACNIRLASPNAVFAHPGVRLGIITGWGGTQRLPRIVGKTRALDLFVTGRRIDCDEAARIGLTSGTYDPVMDRAIELAGQLTISYSGNERFRSGSRQSYARRH